MVSADDSRISTMSYMSRPLLFNLVASATLIFKIKSEVELVNDEILQVWVKEVPFLI